MGHELKALTRRWFEEVWNRKNAAVIDEMLAPELAAHGLAGRALKKADGFRMFYRMYTAAFSGIHVEIHECIAEEDVTACRITFAATHTGDALGFPATGRRIEFGGVIMMRWKDGKIVEAFNQFDQLGLLNQLGQEARRVTPE